MKIIDLLYSTVEECEDYEECLIDEYGNVYDLDENLIEEAAVTRQFKRYGNDFKRQYRCMSGTKKGKVVATPSTCGKRKDPKRIRIGKVSARRKKGERVRKSKRTKRKTLSKLLVRRNKALRGDV